MDWEKTLENETWYWCIQKYSPSATFTGHIFLKFTSLMNYKYPVSTPSKPLINLSQLHFKYALQLYTPTDRNTSEHENNLIVLKKKNRGKQKNKLVQNWWKHTLTFTLVLFLLPRCCWWREWTSDEFCAGWLPWVIKGG